MYKDLTIAELLDATLLVLRLLRGEISFREFVSDYGSFYHEAALDGHEADDAQKQVLQELGETVEFHGKIQTEVVDAVYFEGNGQDIGAYRLTPDQAEAHFVKLCHEYDAEGILRKLKG